MAQAVKNVFPTHMGILLLHTTMLTHTIYWSALKKAGNSFVHTKLRGMETKLRRRKGRKGGKEEERKECGGEKIRGIISGICQIGSSFSAGEGERRKWLLARAKRGRSKREKRPIILSPFRHSRHPHSLPIYVRTYVSTAAHI